jgi:hypothetical protein
VAVLLLDLASTDIPLAHPSGVPETTDKQAASEVLIANWNVGGMMSSQSGFTEWQPRP